MVSEKFQEIEDKMGAALLLYADVVGEIAGELKRERADIEHALLMACVATGTRPLDTAFCINEFLVALHESIPLQHEDSAV